MAKRISRRQLRRSRHVIEHLESRLFLSTTTITANVADNTMSNLGTSPWVGNQSYRVGDNGTNASEQSAIMPFLLPALPVGATITGVQANFYLESIGNAARTSGSPSRSTAGAGGQRVVMHRGR